MSGAELGISQAGESGVTGRLEDSPDVPGRRKRLVELGETLIGAVVEPVGSGHLAFKVGKRTFAYYQFDHHGDGRISFVCKAPPGEQRRLVQESPDLYFIPSYLGTKSWVGFWLDGPRVDWKRVQNLIFAGYFLAAPQRLRSPGRLSGPGKSAKSRPGAARKSKSRRPSA